ncbi:MAG TPA: hypothetical protein VIG51_02030 [Candidatus Baltobacteraceae bacterium]|jgi:hypothetical protein
MYDITDERGVPTSRGVPMAVRIAVLVGVIIIFAIGADVIFNSSYGHQWPANKTLRVPLSSGNGY